MPTRNICVRGVHVNPGDSRHSWSTLRLSVGRKGVLATAAAAIVFVTMSTVVTPGQAFAQAGQEQHTSAAKPAAAPRIVGSESLSPAELTRQRAQEPLLELNNRVYDLTSKVYDAQFAGARLDLANQTLVVYWVGSVPITLSTLQAQAVTGRARLSIRPAPFSRRELMAAAQQVMPDTDAGGTVELAGDGSGLTVEATDLPALASGVKAAAPAQSRLLARIDATRVRTGIPIHLADARPGKPALTDILTADHSAYWAGAEMDRPKLGGGTNVCTSGFSMYAPGSPSTRFTLTVAHCADFADHTEERNGSGEPMGESDYVNYFYNGSSSYDLGVVRLKPGMTNAPSIYLTSNSGDGAIQVTGYASGGILPGSNYCIHGVYGPVFDGNPALSVNCNVYSNDQVRDCTGVLFPGHCVYTIRMQSYDGINPMWCKGDSGGPIYYWTGNTVVAAGVASWANINGGTNCGHSGGASVVATAVNLAGLGVVTTSYP